MHGYAIGSGLEMALCCDIRIASDDARFRLPEVALGMIPFATGSQGLPRTVGRAATLDLLLTGRWFDSPEALRLGIIQRVVAAEGLAESAETMVSELRKASRKAFSRAKASLDVAEDLPLSAGLKAEGRAAALVFAEADSS